MGAGMTGAQFSLSRCEEASITLLGSHPLRTHDFDADPCFHPAGHTLHAVALCEPEFW